MVLEFEGKGSKGSRKVNRSQCTPFPPWDFIDFCIYYVLWVASRFDIGDPFVQGGEMDKNIGRRIRMRGGERG